MSQESLYYKLLNLSDHIDSIASSLQNDIHQLLYDKIITIEELQQDLIQIETDFNHTITELQILKEETLTFLRTFVDEHTINNQ